jgi:hypothetical protein
MAYTMKARLAALAKARAARWPKHKDDGQAAPAPSAPEPPEGVYTPKPSAYFDRFVEQWHEITRKETASHFDYFRLLSQWLKTAPAGTGARLSRTLGYNPQWASNNIRPIRIFGETACRDLALKHGWSWGDMRLLSACPRDRTLLLERALRGEDRRNVMAAVLSTFAGGRVATPQARRVFLRMIDKASPTQIVKWMTEYVSSCAPARAASILRGLTILTSGGPGRSA